jgi:protein involved in sex pheromone biosynthesis
MKNIIFIAALATSIVFASCNSNKTETHGEETEHHDEHENTNTAMLTAEQMKSIKIELGSIEKKATHRLTQSQRNFKSAKSKQSKCHSIIGRCNKIYFGSNR